MNLQEIQSLIIGTEELNNQQQYELFYQLEIIKISTAWKTSAFYGKDEIARDTFIDASFSRFITDALGYSQSKYNSCEKILKVKGGYKKLIMYGRENMVTYCNSSKEERLAILETYAETPGNTTFRALKGRLFPKKKIKKISDKNKKYSDLLAKHKKLVKQNNAVTEKHDILLKEHKSAISEILEKDDRIQKLIATNASLKRQTEAIPAWMIEGFNEKRTMHDDERKA